MKVKLLTSISGPAGAFVPGDIVDLSDAEAARFVERGLAEPVVASAIDAEPESDEPKPARKSRKRD